MRNNYPEVDHEGVKVARGFENRGPKLYRLTDRDTVTVKLHLFTDI